MDTITTDTQTPDTTPDAVPHTRRGLRRTFTSLLVAALTILGIGLGAGPASALQLGTAWANPFSCTYSSYGRMVTAMPPQMSSISGAMETVYWRPDLYRWNGSSWQLYSYGSWYHANADINGTHYQSLLSGTWFNSNNFPKVSGHQWTSLPTGYYEVLNRYQWQNGATASGWSPYSGGGNYCYFSS